MRGKGKNWFTKRNSTGITPAYAGKSVLASTLRVYAKGSPPPMRGKVGQPIARINYGRITPAYAGKSCGRRRNHDLHRDHPRLCGEKRLIPA